MDSYRINLVLNFIILTEIALFDPIEQILNRHDYL